VALLLWVTLSIHLKSHLHTTSTTKSENQLVPSELLLYTPVYKPIFVGVLEDTFDPRLLKFREENSKSVEVVQE
jgi:hypothetical protein